MSFLDRFRHGCVVHLKEQKGSYLVTLAILVVSCYLTISNTYQSNYVLANSHYSNLADLVTRHRLYMNTLTPHLTPQQKRTISSLSTNFSDTIQYPDMFLSLTYEWLTLLETFPYAQYSDQISPSLQNDFYRAHAKLRSALAHYQLSASYHNNYIASSFVQRVLFNVSPQPIPTLPPSTYLDAKFVIVY